MDEIMHLIEIAIEMGQPFDLMRQVEIDLLRELPDLDVGLGEVARVGGPRRGDDGLCSGSDPPDAHHRRW